MRADLKEKLEEYIEYIRLIKESTVLVSSAAMDRSSMEKDFTVFAAYYFPAVDTKPVLIDFEQLKPECDDVVLAYEQFVKALGLCVCCVPSYQEMRAICDRLTIDEFIIPDELLNISNPFKNEKSNKIDFDWGRIIGDDLMWQGRVTRATKRRTAKEMRWLRNHRKT